MNEELTMIREKKLKELYQQNFERETMTEGKVFDAPLHIDDSSFQTVIRQHDMVVVDCWAPWCGPCRVLGPVIDQLAKDYAGKIVFAKLNTDENRETATGFGIMSIPTILVFKKGELVDRMVGALPKPLLQQKLTPHL